MLANDAPWASGHRLVVPDLDAEAFRGFPICTATLRYHGQGINAIMGWVQLVTTTDAATRSTTVEVDVLPFLADAGPLYAYGHLPTFFDAPANPDRPDQESYLIYIKSSLTGDEPEPVLNYKTTCPDFPHETTADQFFDDAQFESYRMLGLFTVAAVTRGERVGSVEGFCEAARTK